MKHQEQSVNAFCPDMSTELQTSLSLQATRQVNVYIEWRLEERQGSHKLSKLSELGGKK